MTGIQKKNNLSMTVCYHVSDKNEYLWFPNQ